MWFETGGWRLTEAQLRDLVTKGKTRKARGARIVLDVDRDDGSAYLDRG